jgi:hypothetical protein
MNYSSKKSMLSKLERTLSKIVLGGQSFFLIDKFSVDAHPPHGYDAHHLKCEASQCSECSAVR